MMGKPVEALTAGMDKVKNMSSPSGPLLKMQQNLKTLNAEQINDIAVYINQLKP
jgi:cytochrome c553